MLMAARRGLAAVILLSACSGSTTSTPATDAPTTTAPATTVTVPADCDRPTGLFPVFAMSDVESGSCQNWVDVSLGRAVRGSTGSASVWSRRTGHGTALIVGAVHTLGQGWFGAEGTDITEGLTDPGAQTGIPRLFLVLPEGTGTDPLASPWFGLYNPAIAAERNGNLMRDVLPREDFYVAVTDVQKLDVGTLAPVPDPIIHDLVPLYDPAGSTLSDSTYAAAEAGSLVLMLGYPNATGELTAAVGRTLTDEEAVAAIARLDELGDPEGALPYEASVELIIEGAAAAGMSGGPVVDRDGRLIGILVRASDEHDGVQYVRAVRITHVVARIDAVFDTLPDVEQAALEGYLER